MKDITIRPATVVDVDDIYEIETLCFPDPWSHASIFSELTENPRAIYLIAEAEGRIAGYAGMWWIVDEGHIINVAVRPEFREQGIGSAIIGSMLEYAGRNNILHCTLEVRAGNDAAIALYEKHGFEVEGVRKGYYQVGHEDALIMWRHEPEPTPTPQPESDSRLQASPEPTPTPQPEGDSRLQASPEPRPTPQPESDSRLQASPEPTPASQPEGDSRLQASPEPTPAPQPESDSRLQASLETTPAPQPENASHPATPPQGRTGQKEEQK